MTFLDHITPVLITYNEEQNIGRALAKLTWASDIVLVDSHSSDDTVNIGRRHAAVRIFERPFDTHAKQWTYAIRETGISTDWVLALDADFILTDEFIAELRALPLNPGVSAYRTGFRYCVAGKPLRNTLYPGVTVLYRKDSADYVQTGHTQRVKVQGLIGNLRSKILHDDRKPLSRWLDSQKEYARLEADYLLSLPADSLRILDRLRLKAWLAPILVFPYILLIKGCILDGWRGWFYAMQRFVAEAMIALNIIDRRLANENL